MRPDLRTALPMAALACAGAALGALCASLLPAVNLAQLSEFSLILIQLGVTSNHLPMESAAVIRVLTSSS